MSDASMRGPDDARPDRLHRWIAGFISALVHLLMLFALLYASKPVITSPESAEGGSRVRVDFIGEPQPSEETTKAEQKPPRPQSTPRVQPPRSRVRSTLVERADNPLPPETPIEAPAVQRAPEPQPQPSEETAQSPSRAPSSPPPSEAQRRPETWTGRPPGMLAEDLAPENAGRANSPAIRNGRGRDMASTGASMEMGGYLVYYDVRNEIRMREWKQQGITELSMPLPGTEYVMVCPLDIALKRGSGKCRALKPDSPEMSGIGDARDVVNMMQIYKQGELVWRGPGPYR